MAVFNAVTNAQGVVTPFLAKSITLTNTAGAPLDPVTITAGVSGADDMAISVDSGVGVAGPTGAGTAGSPYVMNVQSMTVFAKNWRLDIVYNTPNPDSTPASVSFYA
jgi:hypothetical protein